MRLKTQGITIVNPRKVNTGMAGLDKHDQKSAQAVVFSVLNIFDRGLHWLLVCKMSGTPLEVPNTFYVFGKIIPYKPKSIFFSSNMFMTRVINN